MKKIIGVSSCLAGYFVRYDGKTEYQSELIPLLREKYTVLTFCPEVAIGMPVPRQAIHVRKKGGNICVVNKKTGYGDCTEALQDYAKLIAKRYPSLYAYVFKQYSPSCGVGKTKIHDERGEFLGKYDDGVFAAKLKQALPDLLVYSEEEFSAFICEQTHKTPS